MDAKRLEELKQWAINEASDLEEYGDALAIQHRNNFSDLARCAAAWAKVAKSGSMWILGWDQWGDRALLSGMEDGLDSPIEAVEAAEVKP